MKCSKVTLNTASCVNGGQVSGYTTSGGWGVINPQWQHLNHFCDELFSLYTCKCLYFMQITENRNRKAKSPYFPQWKSAQVSCWDFFSFQESIWFWPKLQLSSPYSETKLGSDSSPPNWRTPKPADLYCQPTYGDESETSQTATHKRKI